MTTPVDMVLYCPKCGTQHIDAPEPQPPGAVSRPLGGRYAWTNPPHKTHLCQACGHLWRPSDTPTNGVLRTASGKDADCTPEGYINYILPPDGLGVVPFPAFKLAPWATEPVPRGPRGCLSDAQRAHARAVAANQGVGACIAFTAATAYVNGFQDHADITVNAPPVALSADDIATADSLRRDGEEWRTPWGETLFWSHAKREWLPG